MKKKLISLALVLALTLSLMLPAFAAVTQPAQTHACNHNWILLDRVIVKYESRGIYGHEVYYTYDRICSLCAWREQCDSGSYTEAHTAPCTKCGYGPK